MISVPKNIGQKYYNIHFDYFIKLLQYSHSDIRYYVPKTNDFIININGTNYYVDYFDTEDVDLNIVNSHEHILKFHTRKEDLLIYKNIIPVCPVSFYNWAEYFEIQNKIHYNPLDNNLITNRQRAYGNAKKRRTHVHNMICNIAKTDFIKQYNYWFEINNLLIAICVPGYANTTLDRGQLQYFALGACTISPFIHANVASGISFEPNEHYVECEADYSNLKDKIKWCQNNREACLHIGNNAKQLFLSSCVPVKQMELLCKL